MWWRNGIETSMQLTSPQARDWKQKLLRATAGFVFKGSRVYCNERRALRQVGSRVPSFAKVDILGTVDLQKNSCSYNCTDFVFSPCFCIIKGLCKMGVILVRCTGIMRWAVLSHFSPIQLFVTLWTGPPGSSVHGILQARILEWVAVPFSRGIFSTQGLNLSLHIAGRFFTAEPSGKPCVNQLESSVSWLEREVRDSWETQNPTAAW